MRLRIIGLTVLMLIFAISQTAFAGPAYDLGKRKEKEIRVILENPTKKGTPEHQKKEDKLRSVINEVFDFQELGQRALEIHWHTLTPEQQKEFTDTLQQLIEHNYLLKVTGSTSYKIKWFGEVKEMDYVVVRFKLRSKDYKAAIQFRMIEKNGRWVIFDMLIDDVSLMENYRSQFNRIIKKDGFDELLRRMKDKLEKLKSEGGSGDIEKDKF